MSSPPLCDCGFIAVGACVDCGRWVHIEEPKNCGRVSRDGRVRCQPCARQFDEPLIAANAAKHQSEEKERQKLLDELEQVVSNTLPHLPRSKAVDIEEYEDVPRFLRRGTQYKPVVKKRFAWVLSSSDETKWEVGELGASQSTSTNYSLLLAEGRFAWAEHSWEKKPMYIHQMNPANLQAKSIRELIDEIRTLGDEGR